MVGGSDRDGSGGASCSACRRTSGCRRRRCRRPWRALRCRWRRGGPCCRRSGARPSAPGQWRHPTSRVALPGAVTREAAVTRVVSAETTVRLAGRPSRYL